jgi:hypothetical protein
MDLDEFQPQNQHPMLDYIAENMIPAASYSIFMILMLGLLSCPFWLPLLLENLFGY